MIAYSRRFAALVSFLLCSYFAVAQTVVCRRPGIVGHDAEFERAERFLPANTSDISKAVVYVENTIDGFYFQSNFLTAGADNPTKILTKDSSDFRRIFVSIAYQHSTYEQQETALRALPNIRVLLDQSMFTKDGYPLLDIGDAENVAIVDGRIGKTYTNAVERLDRSLPPPVLMSQALGCCLFGIPPHLAAQYQDALKGRIFDKTNVHLLSLVRDSGTTSAINESANLKKAKLGHLNVPISDLKQIESALKAASGSTVVLVSHVEGANFVVRDPAGKLVSSIPIESVRSLATKYDVELIDLGCETAKQPGLQQLGIGVTTKFNTVDAVRALDRALSHSANYADFFTAITSENIKIVIDHGFLQGWPLCADVYGKAKNKPIWVKLARIFVNFRQKTV